MMTTSNSAIESLAWTGNALRIVDQTLLPVSLLYRDLTHVDEVIEAIKALRVRGAPAIGIAAAYGFYLAFSALETQDSSSLATHTEHITTQLESARPTAVNLRWAVQQVRQTVLTHLDQPQSQIASAILALAKQLHEQDRQTCKAIGLNGQALIPAKANILTHCNTGGLATAQYGTALSMIYHAHMAGKHIHVWVDETRPLLQGGRLTAWELNRAGIPLTLITDSMAGWLMKTGKVDLVVVGADRIALNGDTANKIGTYSLAVLCKAHQIPFYVAAPIATFDPEAKSSDDIPIEERNGREITHLGDRQIAADVSTLNPAFDITPGSLITAFVTEKGLIHSKEGFDQQIPALFK
jgi:methylthioribose-1-phosphate isomerase